MKKNSKLQQTKLISRNKTIALYRKTHTLLETGRKFKLTAERIRQIGNLIERKRCLKHKRYYFNYCSHCVVETYKNVLQNAHFILNEINKARANKKRDYVSIQKRIYLINYLYTKEKKSFREIAVLLDKDLSIIKYLYGKK